MKKIAKTLILLIIVFHSTVLKSQKHFNPDSLKNFYDDKIQIWIGMGQSLPVYYTPNTFGIDIAHKYHCFGYSYSANEKWMLLGDPIKVYRFQNIFYGWRMSKENISASFNLGFGQANLNTKTINIDVGNSTIREIVETKCPNVLLMCKMNLTKRANGMGVILTANLNRVQSVVEAMFVFQFGYEASYHPKSKPKHP